MDDKYDWEVWDPTSLSFRHHMIAGIFAGVSEHIVFFPIDTVRVRFPSASGDFLDDAPGGLFRRNPSQYQGPARRLPCGGGLSRRCIPRSTSFALRFTRRGMWSSTQSTTSFGSTCIHRDGEFFGEACLPRSAHASPPTHCTFRSTSPQRPIWEERTTNISTTIDLGFFTAVHANASAIAGALASVAHDAVMTPLDVLKQRMQLGLYPRPYVAFRSILKNEGFGALYASYFTTILMNIPNAAVLVVTNDWMKSILNPSGNQNFSAFLVSGLVAGALSGFVTCPLDVIKTRIQTQASDSTVVTRKYTGFWQTFKLMLKEEGVRSLFMGVSTRVMQQAPSAALSWTVYESVKRLLA